MDYIIIERSALLSVGCEAIVTFQPRTRCHFKIPHIDDPVESLDTVDLVLPDDRRHRRTIKILGTLGIPIKHTTRWPL